MELEEVREVDRLLGNERVSRGCMIAAVAFSVIGWGLVGAFFASIVGREVAPSQTLQLGGTGFAVGAALMAFMYWRRPQPRLTLMDADRNSGDIELLRVHAFGVASV